MERYGENQDVISMIEVGISGTWEPPLQKKTLFLYKFLIK